MALNLAVADGQTDAAYRVKSTTGVHLIRGSDVRPEPITWLWQDWLPAGKLTILAGDAGTGKTTLTLGLAATVTAAGRWPDGTPCRQAGNVLIWSGEDNVADTLAPRLMAAGADMARCYFIAATVEAGDSRPFDPAEDMVLLAERMREIGGASLLIVDPIVSAVTGNMDKANDVRRSLQALVDLGSAEGCAILGITHFTKGSAGASPLHRVTGSQAFGALARMVLVAGKREGSTERAVTRAKSNIAPDGGGVTYSIDVTEIEAGITASRVLWGSPINGTAREILGDMEYQEDDDEARDLERFLMDLLADGPVYVGDIERDARGAGFSMSTVRRTAKKLGVEMRKDPEFKGRWRWALAGP
ncbi:AAA family ATPase [Cupriavidus sp. DB3]|uniref:AAA family ATPase n=1 Tax=Cupriavidus sp. DB3 TaxID=2873259 RepID=UPI001CF5F436|nr:AAA family ATPase [Cupriavidus sp. DB3]MCA7084068.1 AAA family ATPase [Cupriavidus sp. DB3]